MDTIPRPEYPRPQFRREEWINLNGEWTFALDPGKSGPERGLPESTGFTDRIVVPFCPESTLSGVGHIDFIEAMWYQREIEIPAAYAGKRVLLHFGGVDYESEVFIDGHSVGRNWGGAVGFSHDITRFASAGSRHNLVVHVRDDVRSGTQPGGKQRSEYRFSKMRASYTRTTGIWQTVWIEAVDPHALRDIHILPDIHRGTFTLVPLYYALKSDALLRASVVDADGRVLSTVESPMRDGVPLSLEAPARRLWSPTDPFLHDVELSVVDSNGAILDTVRSYAGLREVAVEGNRVFLNGRPLYQRLVLDQGYYPEGLWTAPSDDALRADIEMAMAAGFNGARLHQKSFEERFHYWADRLGYLTWAEFPSWGMEATNPLGSRNFLSEWKRAVVRDRNHPSIIAWTPLNETRNIQADPREHNRLHVDAYDSAKALDPTRPINDASGYIHVKTDLWTVHDYDQTAEGLEKDLKGGGTGAVFRRFPEWEVEYEGQPYIVAEFGGILWKADESDRYAADSWGYGTGPGSIEEFYDRLEQLVGVILEHPDICGYCYTQLTDVEQEQNGIYTYDRKPKFNTERIAEIFSRLPDHTPDSLSDTPETPGTSETPDTRKKDK
ncbi:MAG: glycoside hydrolase family 2 protein [Spirochaetia bacterium]